MVNILGIIPARGDSKGVPGKNIRLLGGMPLIRHTIKEAVKSKYIDKLILSTDSDEIADVCREAGLEIPFMRPAELAQDNSRAIDTYIYTLKRMETEFNYRADILVVLQPTSPLRTVEDIDGSIEMLINKGADSVISVCEVEHSPYWYKTLDKEHKIQPFTSCSDANANRQELPSVYRPNGAVYVFRNELIVEKQTYYTDKTYAYIMPQERSIDIDTLLDFKIAGLLINGNSRAL